MPILLCFASTPMSSMRLLQSRRTWLVTNTFLLGVDVRLPTSRMILIWRVRRRWPLKMTVRRTSHGAQLTQLFWTSAAKPSQETAQPSYWIDPSFLPSFLPHLHQVRKLHEVRIARAHSLPSVWWASAFCGLWAFGQTWCCTVPSPWLVELQESASSSGTPLGLLPRACSPLGLGGSPGGWTATCRQPCKIRNPIWKRGPRLHTLAPFPMGPGHQFNSPDFCAVWRLFCTAALL